MPESDDDADRLMDGDETGETCLDDELLLTGELLIELFIELFSEELPDELLCLFDIRFGFAFNVRHAIPGMCTGSCWPGVRFPRTNVALPFICGRRGGIGGGCR